MVHGGTFEDGVLDFSVNTNPCVTKEMMEKLLVKHADKGLVYPDIDGTELLQHMCHTFEIEPSRMVLGNGATDCLYRMAATLKPKTAVLIEPTFSEYRKALSLHGCDVYSLSYDFKASKTMAEGQILDQLKKVKADLVVLCHPNNPTGHCYSEDFITQLIKNQKVHKGSVLVDESFRFFEDIKSCYKKDDWNLIVLTSLTKYYGIPGLRIGYMTGNHSLIESMKKSQMPWTLNGLALAVTKDLMEDQSLKEATTAWYHSEKTYIIGALSAFSGLQVFESNTNYVLCHLDQTLGTELNQWLLAQSESMGIRECGDFEGLSDSYIRIGLKSHNDNEKLIHQLEEYWRLNNG